MPSRAIVLFRYFLFKPLVCIVIANVVVLYCIVQGCMVIMGVTRFHEAQSDGSDKHRGLLTMLSACPTREGRGGRCRRDEGGWGRRGGTRRTKGQECMHFVSTLVSTAWRMGLLIRVDWLWPPRDSVLKTESRGEFLPARYSCTSLLCGCYAHCGWGPRPAGGPFLYRGSPRRSMQHTDLSRSMQWDLHLKPRLRARGARPPRAR